MSLAKTFTTMLPAAAMTVLAVISMQSGTHAQQKQGVQHYTSENRYCVYALNVDSTISAHGCFSSKEEADTYRNAFHTWKVLFGADTVTYNGAFGHVRFLIQDSKPCNTSRSYEIPNLTALNLDNVLTNVNGNSYSGCSRIRVWEDNDFNGYSLACRAGTGYCPDLIDGTDGALDLTNKVSSWRALYE